MQMTDIDEYGAQTWSEIEYIRGFVVLRHHVGHVERTDAQVSAHHRTSSGLQSKPAS
jgi:hypothetical protein